MKSQLLFTKHHPQTEHRWGVILAGGHGTRLQRFIKARFGDERPKQYCALIGKRSMLRHTIDRVSPLFSADHLVTTINARHLSWALDDLHDRSPKTVVIQPFNRETAPAILLSLLHVHHADPDAVVALFPADHFILQEDRYRSYVSKAMGFVSEDRDQIVMMGIAPFSLQHGYGWIEKGNRVVSEGIWSVKKFWEKPGPFVTQYLHENSCLWNMMTLVGSTSKLLELFQKHLFEMFTSSQRIVSSLGTTREFDVTEEVFKTMHPVNFSRTILEKIHEQLCVMQMNDIYWSDWGDESRIRTDIDFLRLQHQKLSGEAVHLAME